MHKPLEEKVSLMNTGKVSWLLMDVWYVLVDFSYGLNVSPWNLRTL